jgi:uncharacterized membrane protein
VSIATSSLSAFASPDETPGRVQIWGLYRSRVEPRSRAQTGKGPGYSPYRTVRQGPGKRLLGVSALLLALVSTSIPAAADLRLCNTTKGRIGVAIGYKDGSEQGWATEGWWNVAAQTCETVYKGTLSGRFYYVHAIDYDRGGEWAGQSFMCTQDKAFTIKGVQDCSKRGYNRTGFFEVDTGDAKDWTIRLTDPGESGKK